MTGNKIGQECPFCRVSGNHSFLPLPGGSQQKRLLFRVGLILLNMLMMLDDYSCQCNCHGRIDCSPKVTCKLDFRIMEENLLLELCLKRELFSQPRPQNA